MKTAVTLALLALLTPSLAFAGIPFFDPPATGPAAQPSSPTDPAAAKTVDRDDLINNLTGASDAGAPGSSKLHEITARMEQSTARLAEKDAGRTTQEIQSRIIASLDALIRQLKQSESQNPNPKPSRSSDAQQPGQRASGNGVVGTSPASTSDPKAGSPAAPWLSQQLSELRSDFMQLPYRDRQAMLNMKGRDCLPGYKEMVSRYYAALAETAKSRRNR